MVRTEGSVLITGANGGLGTAFVANLLKSPKRTQYQGIYSVRNPATAHELRTVLQYGPHDHQYCIYALDLSSLESIRAFAEDINSKVANGTLQPIRALILNAAWQEANTNTLKPQTFTKDGFEGNFGTNYLANFLLVLLLLQSLDKEHGRIIGVSSYTHDTYDPHNNALGFFGEEYKEVFKSTDALAKGVEYQDDGYLAGMRRYGASKTLMVMFMFELQRRINSDPALSKISVMSLDPGGMPTAITRNSEPPLLVRVFINYILPYILGLLSWIQPNGPVRTTMKSGADLLRAAYDVDTLGEYPKAVYLDGTAVKETSVEARDQSKQLQLWEDSVKLARVRPEETLLKEL